MGEEPCATSVLLRGRIRYLCLMKLLSRFLPLLLLLVIASCRSCPIQSCHTRKVHMHSGVRYRGQPLWKKQNPAIGEKIKTLDTKAAKQSNDRNKTLR